MVSRVSTEFKHEVVRVALTSGLSRRQIASDFDIGFSTLGRWIKEEREQVFESGFCFTFIPSNVYDEPKALQYQILLSRTIRPDGQQRNW